VTTSGLDPAGQFADWPDLASRRLGASVVAANDELFAQRENLINPQAPAFAPHTFGHRGQVMDGWETRRRRDAGSDWVIVRLGLPGIVRGVIVDTSFFTGNFPPEVSVDGAAVDGHPDPAQLAAAAWSPLVALTAVAGDTRNALPVDHGGWITHVRLSLYPDGGVARLRVHGQPLPDPRFLGPTLDLAALANGGRVTGCSNGYYSAPANVISPGEARVTGDGWETARRRDDDHDWLEIALAGPGVIAVAELDTSCFVGNAPGWARLIGTDARQRGIGVGEQVELLPRTRLQPDTRHRFRLSAAAEVTDVRMEIFPDGGMARVRLWGALSAAGREAAAVRWFNALPADLARAILVQEGEVDTATADALVAGRPLLVAHDLPEPVRHGTGG
jgi:allantoicase